MKYIEIMKVNGKTYYLACVNNVCFDFDSLELARNFIRLH